MNWVTREDERYYYVKDLLPAHRSFNVGGGSIRHTYDTSGVAAVAAQDYLPYGRILRQYNNVYPPKPFSAIVFDYLLWHRRASPNERYKFTEKERDTETSYDYFGARYYDSDIGRWLSVDPLSDKYPGWSPYIYTNNNPLIYIDSDGRDWVKALKHLVSSIGFGAETVSGISLAYVSILGAPYAPKISIGGFTIGGLIAIHGGTSMGLNLYNGIVETARSISNNENLFEKLPDGALELLTSHLTNDESANNFARIVDVVLSFYGGAFAGGLTFTGHAKLEMLERILTSIDSGMSVSEAVKQEIERIIKEQEKKKKQEEEKEEEENKSDG